MLGIIISWRYRAPLLMTGNAFILVFIARLGTDFTWPELIGAAMLAGSAVLMMIPLGLTKALTRFLPPYWECFRML